MNAPPRQDKFRAYRDRKKAAGLREVRMWVPDTRSPEFIAEARRQAALLNHSDDEKEAIALMDRLTRSVGGRQLALNRGDVVLVAEGKPRPAVIVQSDRLPTPDAILLCPLTSFIVEAPLYRPTVLPSTVNGLALVSQLMLDRVNPARRSRIDRTIGRLEDTDLERLNTALAILLDLVG